MSAEALYELSEPHRMSSQDVKTWIRDRGLTLLLMSMFALFVVGQVATGHAEYNAEQQEHGKPRVTLTTYLGTGHPWEALFENWESEFLQMAVFVLLTTFLIQKGSPESRRPGVKELVDTDPRDFADDPEAPWPVRRGGWILRLYEHSLGLAFIGLFIGSWVGHAVGGFAEYAADEVLHAQPQPTFVDSIPIARVWVLCARRLRQALACSNAHGSTVSPRGRIGCACTHAMA